MLKYIIRSDPRTKVVLHYKAGFVNRTFPKVMAALAVTNQNATVMVQNLNYVPPVIGHQAETRARRLEFACAMM